MFLAEFLHSANLGGYKTMAPSQFRSLAKRIRNKQEKERKGKKNDGNNRESMEKV